MSEKRRTSWHESRRARSNSASLNSDLGSLSGKGHRPIYKKNLVSTNAALPLEISLLTRGRDDRVLYLLHPNRVVAHREEDGGVLSLDVIALRRRGEDCLGDVLRVGADASTVFLHREEKWSALV